MGRRFSRRCADYPEFLGYTGVGKAEAAWVAWKHVDFERGEILIQGNPDDGTKNWEVRRIPMIPAARALLERLRHARLGEREPEEIALTVREAQKAM